MAGLNADRKESEAFVESIQSIRKSFNVDDPDSAQLASGLLSLLETIPGLNLSSAFKAKHYDNQDVAITKKWERSKDNLEVVLLSGAESTIRVSILGVNEDKFILCFEQKNQGNTIAVNLNVGEKGDIEDGWVFVCGPNHNMGTVSFDSTGEALYARVDYGKDLDKLTGKLLPITNVISSILDDTRINQEKNISEIYNLLQSPLE